MKVLLAWGLLAAFPCNAIAQIAILHLRVIEGDGAVHRMGARAARPLTVEVTDETGRPQPAVAVSFHLPEEGPGGTLPNGLRTDLVLTDVNGRASLRGLQANRIAGPFRIRITAVKDQVRAGLVSLQYVADGKPGKEAAAASAVPARPAPPPPAPVQAKSHASRKWIIVALAAAGVAAGIGAGASAGKSSSSAAQGATPAQVSIGVPSISLVKP